MNTVSGKVLVKETGVGVPDLLITVYDCETTEAGEGARVAGHGAVASGQPQRGLERLGSVLTDEDGRFALSYGDSRKKHRADLVLTVSAAEGPGTAGPVMVYDSARARRLAGTCETYLIRLATHELEKAGIPIPLRALLETDKTEAVVHKLVQTEVRNRGIQEGFRAQVAAKRIDRERAIADEYEAKYKKLALEALSKVPEAVRKSPNYVGVGECVAEKSRRVIQRDIEEIINKPDQRPAVAGYIMLDDQEREALEHLAGGQDYVELPSSAEIAGRTVQEILCGAKEGGSRTSFLVRQSPSALLANKAAAEESTAGSSGASSAPSLSGGDGETLEPAAAEDIARYVARMENPCAPPEEAVAITVPQRASQASLQGDVDGLHLRGGPADVPAFHDFYSLQIAFGYVWQELHDRTLQERIERLVAAVSRQGGRFEFHPGQARSFLDELRAEARNVLNAGVEAETAQVVARANLSGRDLQESGAARAGGQERFPDLSTGRTYEPTGGPADSGAGKSGLGDPASSQPGTNLPDLISALEAELKGKYDFTVYAPGSVNYGLLVTYRQKWEPLGYQVGELVSSIPLAPKEVRKFSKKVVTRRSRKEREVENGLQVRKQEASQTSRAEMDIVRKAQQKTNFNLTAEASVSDLFGCVSGKMGSALEIEAGTASDEVKKDFRESVFKAAEEYKQERTLEVSTEWSQEFEAVESGELSNPNDELPVTFLFYELQRRHRVSEMIHKLTPVVLVAQQTPEPQDIDADWLVRHDWILRRVLLDDTFLPALTYVSTTMVGDEHALAELRINVTRQRKLVERLGAQVSEAHEFTMSVYSNLRTAMFNYAESQHEDDKDRAAAQVGVQSAREYHDEAVKREKDLVAEMGRETTTLEKMTETYTQALTEHWNHMLQVDRLRVHLKQNILYYMQAIWSHEPPDQRFFRMHHIKAPILKAAQRKYRISRRPDRGALAAAAETGRSAHRVEDRTRIELDTTEEPLSRLADLGNLLGFKGNYAIFPLKQSNALTDLMITPYVDAFFELHDPDDASNWTVEEFSAYVNELRGRLTTEQFDRIKAQLSEQYKRLVSAGRPGKEEIVVPTGSLYIEALPGAHPILEDFKLMHRAVDVKKVQAEVRKAELENVRLAARLLAGEREDPEVEKKVIIEGASSGVFVPAGDQ